MTLFDDGENAVVPVQVQLPGRDTTIDAWVTVDALAEDEVVLTAEVNGDTLVTIFINEAAAFLAQVRAVIKKAPALPPECIYLPYLFELDAELPVAHVRLPGQKLARAHLAVRATHRQDLTVEVYTGKSVLSVATEEATNLADLVAHALDTFEPDDVSDDEVRASTGTP